MKSDLKISKSLLRYRSSLKKLALSLGKIFVYTTNVVIRSMFLTILNRLSLLLQNNLTFDQWLRVPSERKIYRNADSGRFEGYQKMCLFWCAYVYKQACTLDSGINVGVRLLIFEKFWRQKKIKNDRNA